MKKAILLSNRPINLTEGSKAYPLNMSDMPKGNGTPESLAKIIEFLNVEKSGRYVRKEVAGKVVATYCNIYAFDYAYLAGAYIPRVWWTKEALKTLTVQDIEAKYGTTVVELNANSLYDWFVEHSSQFGWTKPATLEEAQKRANAGEAVIIVAKQKIVSRSGHICAIAPELNGQVHKVANGEFIPLQSQSGFTNKKYFADNWFKNPRYSGWGVWSFKP